MSASMPQYLFCRRGAFLPMPQFGLRLGKVVRLSQVEIGQRLDLAFGTVELQPARALRRLRSKLNDDATPPAKSGVDRMAPMIR